MRNRVFWVVGAIVAASFAACVGSDPSSSTAAQGALYGACFSNGTCNPGLSCDPSSGACVPGGDASSSTDGSTTTDGGSSDDGDSTACVFSTSVYPCKPPAQVGSTACFNATTVDCTASGCGGDDMWWSCYSPRQCSSLQNCCMPLASATLDVGVTCAEGTMTITDGGAFGGQCTSGACAGTDIQLCQGAADCLPTERCNEVKISGGGNALNNQEIGVCVPK